jgi:hypothetical protein
MPAQEQQDLLNFAHKDKTRNYIDSCSVAPDHVNTHDFMCKHIVKLTNRLIASKYFLKELEQTTLVWLEVTGQAEDQWHIVVREAEHTATTSAISPNSVLYRALHDMLLAYPAQGVKTTIMCCKATDLVWVTNKTVVEIHSAVIEYYETYDREVV